MRLIDTHSHIYVEEFDSDRDIIVKTAQESGISKLLLPNIDDTTIGRLMDTCSLYPDFTSPMMGFHPTSVEQDYAPRLQKIEKALSSNAYCAIGEIGIDLYWDKTYIKEQKEVFEEQLRWSIDMQLPVAIHMRESFEEVMDCIHKVGAAKMTGVFHSFTGSAEELEEIMKLERFMIGINGVVTFKNSKLGDVLANTDMSRILLETDAPYLSPVPFRGKRNEPAYIWKTAEKIAQIYDTSTEVVVNETTKNALKLFKNL